VEVELPMRDLTGGRSKVGGVDVDHGPADSPGQWRGRCASYDIVGSSAVLFAFVSGNCILDGYQALRFSLFAESCRTTWCWDLH
jgi:hypothetical protein